jgi:hypothetical protein
MGHFSVFPSPTHLSRVSPSVSSSYPSDRSCFPNLNSASSYVTVDYVTRNIGGQLRRRIQDVPDPSARALLTKIANTPGALETMHKVTSLAVSKGYIDPKNPTQPPSVFKLMRDSEMVALLQQMMFDLTLFACFRTHLTIVASDASGQI